MSIAGEAAKAVRAFDNETLFDLDAGKSEVMAGAKKLRDLLNDLVNVLVVLNPDLAPEVEAALLGCPECERVLKDGRDHADWCEYTERER